MKAYLIDDAVARAAISLILSAKDNAIPHV